MTINIPEWLLWLIGVPVGALVLIFAVIGVWLLWKIGNMRVF